MPKATIILQTVMSLLLVSGSFQSALAGQAEVQAIQISPSETKIGIYPDITGSIKVNKVNAPSEALELIVIAVVFRPDHLMKSWMWQKVNMKAGEVKQFTIPREYSLTLAGSYKVDFNVYTRDMRPLHRLSRNLVVIDPSLPHTKTITAKKDVADTTPLSSGQASTRLGVGIYANTLNHANGATVLVWPYKYVGLAGSYAEDSFTIAEGRFLARLPLSSGIKPYVGIGYLSVSTERTVDIINVRSKFRDSGVSGVVGAEISLNKSIYGYIELSGANIDLKQKMSSGILTGTASVKYAPVTIGIGIVYYLF